MIWQVYILGACGTCNFLFDSDWMELCSVYSRRSSAITLVRRV